MNREEQVPDWMLERYLLDELPRKQRRQLEKELERNPRLRSELDRLRVADRQILSTYPPERMIPEILKRAGLAGQRPAPPRRWRLAWMMAPALAVVLFLLVILPPILQRRLESPGTSGPGEYIGSKGDKPLSRRTPALLVYRKSGDEGLILRNGDAAGPGDLLQVAYSAGRQTHGVIISIDGAGSATLHFPQNPGADTALQGGGRVFLADAFELDQAPRFERFIFITAREPLPTGWILEKARQLAASEDEAMTGKLDLPARFGQVSLLLRK